jgi:hypothetical protein
MPPQKSIRRDHGVEFEQSLSPYGLGLARQKNALSVGEPDSPSAQPLLEQCIFCLEELNNDKLMAMNPVRHHH